MTVAHPGARCERPQRWRFPSIMACEGVFAGALPWRVRATRSCAHRLFGVGFASSTSQDLSSHRFESFRRDHLASQTHHRQTLTPLPRRTPSLVAGERVWSTQSRLSRPSIIRTDDGDGGEFASPPRHPLNRGRLLLRRRVQHKSTRTKDSDSRSTYASLMSVPFCGMRPMRHEMCNGRQPEPLCCRMAIAPDE